ncbi:MAG: hypothetical protein ABGX16_17370 [Pirellulales bacterium]
MYDKWEEWDVKVVQGIVAMLDLGVEEKWLSASIYCVALNGG